MTAREARGVSQSVKALSLCVAVLAVAALAAAVEPARACSCVPPDPWSYLERADGAFVGRLVSRRESGEGRAVLVFSVERAVKGKIADNVEVETASSGAACGIETSVGRRIGLFLMREGDAWFGHLCWQVEPENLLAAASLPAPNGRGSAALFVGGRFGPARTLTLDAKGRTLAYGLGTGATTLLSPCPGGQRLAEIAPIRSDARMRTTYEIAIREATSLRVIRRQALKLPGWRFANGLQCEDGLGSSVVIVAGWAGDAALRAAIYRLKGRRLTAVWEGTAFLSSLTAKVAYLNSGFSAARLVRVDLRTSRVTRIAWLPRSPSLVPDTTGKRLAGVAYLMDKRSRIVLVDLTTRPVSIRSIPLAAPDVLGDVLWLSRDRFLFLPFDSRETARVLDLRLSTRSRFRWTGGQAALLDLTVFGTSFRSGALVAAKVPSGPQRVIRHLPGRPEVIVSATR